MHYTSLFMQVQQSLCDLGDDVSRKVFTKVCETNDLVEELTARAKLQDDVVVLTGFDEFNEFDDIWVVKLSHNLNFLENVCALLGVSIQEH